jgi:hypothetical protein
MAVRKRFILFLILPTLFVLGGAFTLRLSISPLLNHLASAQLQQMGLDHIAFDVSDISINHVVVSGIEIGSDKSLEIPELKASFLWSDLISGRVEKVEFSDIRFRVQIVGGGLSFGALDPLFFGSQGEQSGTEEELTLPDWPIKQVNITSATVEVESVFGSTILPFSGVIRQLDDLSVALEEARVKLVRDDMKFDAKMNASLTPNGSVDATITLDQSHADVGDILLSFSSGEVNLNGNLSDLRGFSGQGRLNIDESRLPFGVYPTADMTMTLENHNANIKFDVYEARSDITAGVRVVAESVFDQNPDLSLTVDVKSGDLSKISSLLALPVSLEGVSDIHIQTALPVQTLIELSEAEDPQSIIDLVPDVTVQFAGQALAAAAVGAKGAISGELKLRTQGGQIEIVSTEDIKADLSGGILQPINKGANPYIKGALQSVRVSMAPTITLRADQVGEQALVTVQTGWKIDAEDNRDVSGHIVADLKIPLTSPHVPLVKIHKFILNTKNLPLAEGGFMSADLMASADGQGQDFEGLAAINLSMSSIQQPGVSIEMANLDTKLAFVSASNQTTVYLSGCERFQLSGIHLPEILAPIRKIEGCIRQNGMPAININEDNQISFDVGVDMRGNNIALEMKDQPVVHVAPEDMTFHLAGLLNQNGGLSADIAFAGNKIGAPEYDLSLNRWSGDIHYNTRVPDSPEVRVELEVQSVEYLTEGNLVPPLRFRGQVVMNDEESSFTAGVRGKGDLIRADIDGSFDLDAKFVEASLRIPPITLGPNARKIHDYYPDAKEWVSEANGLGFIAGKMSWNEDEGARGDFDVLMRGLRSKLRIPGEQAPLKVEAGQLGLSLKAKHVEGKSSTSAEILVENAHASMEELAVNGVNAMVSLDAIWPPSTPEPQSISVSQVLGGLPFDNGKFDVSINGVDDVSITGFSFELAKGQLTAEPVTISYGVIPNVKIHVKDLDLEELARLVNKEGVVARGMLNGELPVAFRDQDIFIENAVLEAEPGGMIGYAPNGSPKGQSNEIKVLEIDYTEMMMGALTNFNYDQLKVKVNGRGRGDTRVGMSLKGRNPDFFTGHPVELEVNVNGRLVEILKTGVNNYEVPENIKQRMLGFGR